MGKELLQNIAWIRDPRNPVIPPDGTLGHGVCMNPWVIRSGDTYFLFYASVHDDQGRRTIHLATAPASDPTAFSPQGKLFENGAEGEFDHHWCVLPTVVQIRENLWYMFFTGRNQTYGDGLDTFAGIGLAVSNDLYHWKKYEGNPVIRPGDIPRCVGMASGSILKTDADDGGYSLWFYCGAFETTGDDHFLDQQKRGVRLVSRDGIRWEYRGEYLKRNIHHDYENVAAVGGCALRENGLTRLWYNGIGTHHGFYSICYAESGDDDRLVFGDAYGENLSLGPTARGLHRDYDGNLGWQNRMCEYPSVIREGERLRLFYSGNGYGSGGIGTALSADMRVAPADQSGEIRLWVHGLPRCFHGSLASSLTFGGISESETDTAVSFTMDTDFVWEAAYQNGSASLECRAIVFHHLESVEIKYTFVNNGTQPVCGLRVSPSFAEPDLPFRIEAVQPIPDTVRPGETVSGVCRLILREPRPSGCASGTDQE